MDQGHVCTSTAFVPFPEPALDGSIGERFAEQVARHRDCPALVDDGLRLTYGELDAWSNGVAHAIVDALGPGPEPVALVLRQGAAYAAGVLGAVKAGRPYVPLDPADPALRLRDLVSRSGAALVLAETTTRAVAAAAADTNAVAHVDRVACRREPPDVQVGPDALAYVFFTSGSTGEPKGVYDSHRNVLHNVLRYTNALEICPLDRLTLLQGPAFSGCVSSQLGALLNGATSLPFRLAEEGLVRAAEWLLRERITIYHSVPALFRAIVGQGAHFPDVRVVRLEGDRATSEDVSVWKRHFAPDCILANGLGTTETGLARQLVLRASDPVEPGALPVGHAVRDMELVLVDGGREPVPAGAVGEIAFRSDYLALGYWSQPDVTADRFASRDGQRTYFTGDLGRLRDDGCLEYLGRREDDLKILGTRVEPAEIESELLSIEGVRQAAVAVREGARGDGQVVAYVVCDESGAPDLESVRRTLAQRLPRGMLPTALVALETLPLGSNGKVDRRLLPDPAPRDPGRPHSVATEQWLADTWSDVLGIDSVGPEEDFFALGGDSLAGAEILARVERETGRSLPLSSFLTAPTVGLLARQLNGREADRRAAVTVLRRGSGGLAPMILVHGAPGHVLHYGALVEALAGERPLWALEYHGGPPGDRAVDALVEDHLAALADALPGTTYLLVGFCYGAVIAHELGRRLATADRDVHIALLGITPVDFPTVVSGTAYERWLRVYGPTPGALTRSRYHLRATLRLPPREMPAYLARRARNLGRRHWLRLRARWHDDGSSSADGSRLVLRDHDPEPFPGRPLLVLQHNDTMLYTRNPGLDWARLGSDGVDVAVVPGSTGAMLELRGATELASVLGAWADSATANGR